MERLLQPLLAIDGVAGVVVAGRDGLLMATTFDDTRAGAHTTQAAAVFEVANRYTRQLAIGTPQQTIIIAGTSTLIITEMGDLLLIVEARSPALLGHLRIECERVARLLPGRPHH
jgi:predicted regulator of Ras-like GTPase activity (Roadblock/LC7/MglB family)